jgi:hypothetical protein
MRVDCSRLFRATPQREPGRRPLRSEANRNGGKAFLRPPPSSRKLRPPAAPCVHTTIRAICVRPAPPTRRSTDACSVGSTLPIGAQCRDARRARRHHGLPRRPVHRCGLHWRDLPRLRLATSEDRRLVARRRQRVRAHRDPPVATRATTCESPSGGSMTPALTTDDWALPSARSVHQAQAVIERDQLAEVGEVGHRGLLVWSSWTVRRCSMVSTHRSMRRVWRAISRGWPRALVRTAAPW